MTAAYRASTVLAGEWGLMMRGRIAWMIGAGAWASAGCTVVHIEGARSATVHAGVLRIAPAEHAAIMAYRSEGIGIVPGHRAITIGAASERAAFVFVPDRCSVILFEPSIEAVERLAAIAAETSQQWKLCTVGETKR